MNVKNNQRRRNSREKIETAFVDLLQSREIKEISISEIIKRTGLNRSTFYANYLDIYDLADKTREKFESDFQSLFADYDRIHRRDGALRMFSHIRDNQLFYKTYFKLCYDDTHLLSSYDLSFAKTEKIDTHIRYHIEFFRNGLNAIIKLWLAGGCHETPEEMADVLKREYRGRYTESDSSGDSN